MNETPESPLSAESPASADFDSLRDVEFAGDQSPAVETAETIETHEDAEALTLEEKVARLRAPFEADEAVRTAREHRLSQLKIEADTRAEELDSLRKTRDGLLAKQSSLSAAVTEQQRKFTSRLRLRLGMKNRTVAGLASRRNIVQGQVYALDHRENELAALEDTSRLETDELLRQPDYEPHPEPLSVAEKARLLTPEALAELSLDEYIALWRRLNPFYASHVTRQGIRDHNSMFYHSAGMGEFSHGFTEMLGAGKSLHSASEVRYGLPPEGFTEDDVRHALKIAIKDRGKDIDERLTEGASTAEVADDLVDHLPYNYTWASAEPWSDVNAIHFGRNTCLDETYGAEKGNEVFYIFPIDVIASQSRFGGHVGRGFDTAQVASERKWNDMFVWSETGRIPLDSGIVFLPKSAEVSPETGSLYETVESIGPNGEKVREPFLDEAVVQTVDKIIQTLEGEGAFDEYGLLSYEHTSTQAQCDALVARFRDEFGLSQELAERLLDKRSDLLCSRHRIIQDDMLKFQAERDGFSPDTMDEEEKYRIYLRYNLEFRTFGFQKAKNPTPAETYWRKYFEAHPEQRPKHVVFYDGDPSDAADQFLLDHHIVTRVRSSKSDTTPNVEGPGDTHEQDGPWLGYDDHLVRDPEHDERMQREHARFNSIARRLAPELIEARRS